MKYCTQGVIDLMTTHDGVSQHDRNLTQVGFSMTLELNEKFDSEMIISLLNELSQNREDDFVRIFISLYDLIEHFGLGMVILPSIISNLNGKCKAKFLNQSNFFTIQNEIKLDLSLVD